MLDKEDMENMIHEERRLSFFEKYLTLWVLVCIVLGILLGRFVPNIPNTLDRFSIYNISIPIAICLFFMMYPIMVKIDFKEVIKAGKTPKPVFLTLFINWLVKPFTMFLIAWLFIGVIFKGLVPGFEILKDGTQIELYRSYIAGCILLGIAPCTAMVLIWGHLSKGNDGHTLVMVAINSLTMLFLYAPLGSWLLGINKMPIPWQTIVLSVLMYVGFPLLLGYYSRKIIIKKKGVKWFEEQFIHYLTPISILALLVTLIVLFAFKGDLILKQPQTILIIAIPLFIQTCFIFGLTYILSRFLKLAYRDAAPSALIGASNHFEVAIATATVLFGLSSGAALATVVGVLIEVPVMLMLVRVCLKSRNYFK
ncbi:ACR3 family arsenite efflux transporter [bacterium]